MLFLKMFGKKMMTQKLFERQLIELADYVIEHNLFNKFKCSLFDEGIGGFIIRDKQRTYCGAGKMIAIDPEGKLFPCIRYKDYSLNNKPEWGHMRCRKGGRYGKGSSIYGCYDAIQSDDECLNCEVAVGCGFFRDLIMMKPKLRQISVGQNIFVKCTKQE